MFVGESGVSRVIARTCQVMNERKTDDPAQLRAAGVIDLPTIQRYLNFHYSVTIDLFGADQSSNAATFYSAGLKGRFEEGKRADDHLLRGATYRVLEVADGRLAEKEVPMLNALNEVLRDDFIRDSEAGIGRWNKVIEKAGLPHRLQVPHKAFNRRIGTLAGVRVAPDGRVVGDAEWERRSASGCHRRGPRLRRLAHGPRGRARAVRELDRAAGRRASTGSPSTSNTCDSVEPRCLMQRVRTTSTRHLRRQPASGHLSGHRQRSSSST